jgi:hypothetical protein
LEDLSSKSLAYQSKRGWRKVVESARHAAQNGWDYIWIDTCCINKSDITELSEAINSMFRWYESAQVCYAHLADVPPRHSSLKHPWAWSFRSSRWYTRGWTLQELLAPTFLEFLDSEWNVIGSRDEWAHEIELATGIEVKQLANFQDCSVATKLSWAANRETTRIEDRAYSLLGLLGVNMLLIYGEGERAFTRLQHELIRSSNDESIFAWGPPLGECRNMLSFLLKTLTIVLTPPAVSGRAMPRVCRDDTDEVTGRNVKDSPILAPSPKDYERSRGVIRFLFDKRRRGFAITNAGLSLNAEVWKMGSDHQGYEPLYLIQLSLELLLGLAATPIGKEPVGALPPGLRHAKRRPRQGSPFLQLSRVGASDMAGVDSGQWFSLGRHRDSHRQRTFHKARPLAHTLKRLA